MQKIANLWATQRSLKRTYHLSPLIGYLEATKFRDARLLPTKILGKILLEECDGRIYVGDGHHRVAAVWLSGRDYLDKYEYTLILPIKSRIILGRMVDLIEMGRE